MNETMRWENDGTRLMLGDDELARIDMSKPGKDAWFARFSMPIFKGASGSCIGHHKEAAHSRAKAEIINRIKQGRDPLLYRAREDAALAERIVNAEFPEGEA